jgi:hypothetical protein
LKQLLLALADDADEDHEDALAYLEDLREWLENGGVVPDVDAVVDSIYGEGDPDDEYRGAEEGTDPRIDLPPEELPPEVGVPAEPEAASPAPARRRRTVQS